jgi:hypothetical protein
LRIFGFGLAILVFAGNGLLQNADFISWFHIDPRAPVLKNLAGFYTFAAAQRVLWPLLGILFVMDFWQEKTRDVDCFVRILAPARVFLATAFLAWFFFGLYNVSSLYSVDPPPLYFRF